MASSSDSNLATVSFDETRFTRSPGQRWPKNGIGSVTRCQKKRVVIRMESFASIRARNARCNHTRAPCSPAADTSPISRATTQSPLPRISTLSTNTRAIVGTATPGTSNVSVATVANASAPRAFPKRARSPRTMLGFEPPFRKRMPGAKASPMPE